jgi:hypothetical protein
MSQSICIRWAPEIGYGYLKSLFWRQECSLYILFVVYMISCWFICVKFIFIVTDLELMLHLQSLFFPTFHTYMNPSPTSCKSITDVSIFCNVLLVNMLIYHSRRSSKCKMSSCLNKVMANFRELDHINQNVCCMQQIKWSVMFSLIYACKSNTNDGLVLEN